MSLQNSQRSAQNVWTVTDTIPPQISLGFTQLCLIIQFESMMSTANGNNQRGVPVVKNDFIEEFIVVTSKLSNREAQQSSHYFCS